MEMSAPELEGRTFVPWWALPLAMPLVVLLALAAGAFALAVAVLIASPFVMNEVSGALLSISELVLALLVTCTFAFVKVWEAVADPLVNRHRWRARHLRSGRCPWCRYDICGLPEPRCPECGETW